VILLLFLGSLLPQLLLITGRLAPEAEDQKPEPTEPTSQEQTLQWSAEEQPIHPSAWKVCSRKFGCSILDIPTRQNGGNDSTQVPSKMANTTCVSYAWISALVNRTGNPRTSNPT